jgi:DNA-binding LacI/PurR family transcriptional regulator
MARVTIADVALAAGVSVTAVSFAFNNPERLSQSTLDRVLGVARDVGYTPHPAARALSLRRSGSIGVLVPQRLATVFANPFTAEIIQGLAELCEAHDLNLLLVPPLDGSLEGAIRAASVDGFISLGLSAGDPAIDTMDRLGIPAVLIDSEDTGERSTHLAVNVDDAGGAEAAARHLLELGHREVALVMLPPTSSRSWPTPVTARRLAGYMTALGSAGIEAPFTLTAAATMAAGARAFAALPRGRRRPTAALVMSDMAAFGMLAAAQEAGIRIPEDFSVVGYDDLPMAAWTTPALTTVRQPIVEKGRTAANLLIRRMQGKTAVSPPPLTTELVVRASTGKPGPERGRNHHGSQEEAGV